MRKKLGIVGIFFLGFLTGAVVMNLMEMRARAMYRRLIQTDLATEQAFLAARAARNGDLLRSLVHRWNVVDARAQNGFRAFRAERAAETERNFWLPFHAFVLEMIDAGERAHQLGEGIERGRLAMALEKLGQDGAAQHQWKMAVDLTGLSSDRVRQFVENSMGLESSELHRQAETAVLGPETKIGN